MGFLASIWTPTKIIIFITENKSLFPRNLSKFLFVQWISESDHYLSIRVLYCKGTGEIIPECILFVVDRENVFTAM